MTDPNQVSPDRIEQGKGIQPGTPRTEPDRTQFQAFMQEGAGKPPTAGPGATGVSPIELATPGIQTSGPNINTLMAQTNSAQDQLGRMQNTLQDNPDLKFKTQHQYLLQNKLSDANDHLRAANSRLGVQTPPLQTDAEAGPIERFLGYVTDSQNQITAAQSKLQALSQQGTQLNPGELLLMQVQLSQAQQELEYSSTLLSKVVDLFKQMLNIQL